MTVRQVSLAVVVLGLLVGSAASADERTITFKAKGKTVRELTLTELRALVAPQTARVVETHEGDDREYEGFPFTKVLDVVYGTEWSRTEEVLFTCVDGYQPSIPVDRFQRYRAFLTFDRKGGPFELVNRQQNNEHVKLGPFYLVWDNIAFPALKAEGSHGWPYQVIGVDLIHFADRFPNLAPPERAPAAVRRGFLTFREKCLMCHSINGQGGTKGVELNYPVNVTEYFDARWLRQWIADPRSIRYSTTMPALDVPEGKERTIDDLVRYLRAMAKQKRAPRAE